MRYTHLILFAALFLGLYSCKDDTPKSHKYVIKGKLSITNTCPGNPPLELDTVVVFKDTVGRNVKISIDMSKGAKRLPKQTQTFRLNESLEGQYSFTFESEQELDTNWKWSIPVVKIDCPTAMCNPFDSISFCRQRFKANRMAQIKIRKDTTTLDLPMLCNCIP